MADEIKYVKVKYIPTGMVFNLPEADVIETIKSDSFNFEVLDKNFKIPSEETEVKTTTFEKVVEDEVETREEVLNKLKVAELITYCDENNIQYDKKDKKADLIAKIIEAEKVIEDEVEHEVENESEEN